jgi:hypothetical protein
MRLCRRPERVVSILAAAFMLLMAIGSAYGKKKKEEPPPFLYMAGTEKIAQGCGGKLEVLKEGFAFHCQGGDFSLPYTNIVVMQYRPNLSNDVAAMKIPWAYPPVLPRVSRNVYFTIVSKEDGKLRAVVLRVEEKDMQPYFAEIELESGKSVQEFRSYDEFQNGIFR